MPLPTPASSHAPHPENEAVAATVESVEPEVMKEKQPPMILPQNQGDGEGSSVVVGRRHKVVPSRIKLSNFSPKEDVFLVKSWLEISCDPIINTGKKKEGFWARIICRYNNKRGSFPERSVKSLQSRWDTIKTEASKFAGHMASVLRDNPSGMSDADKTSLALANFADIQQHPFTFVHCWDVLKGQPKWMELSIRRARPGDDDVIADHIPTASSIRRPMGRDAAKNARPGDDDVIADHIPTASSIRRPMGRDAAKKAAKKSASSSPSDSSQYVSKLQDLSIPKISIWQEENAKKGSRYEQMAAIESQRYDEVRQHNQHMAAIEEEKLRIMRKKADRLQTHEEERILGIDLDKCAPRLRKYYEKKQQEILKNIGADEDDSVDP